MLPLNPKARAPAKLVLEQGSGTSATAATTKLTNNSAAWPPHCKVWESWTYRNHRAYVYVVCSLAHQGTPGASVADVTCKWPPPFFGGVPDERYKFICVHKGPCPAEQALARRVCLHLFHPNYEWTMALRSATTALFRCSTHWVNKTSQSPCHSPPRHLHNPRRMRRLDSPRP